ncbi:hypothetical protein BDW02DRAFT_305957 [Decorospora gaudefroyi]|uniref:DUF7136 domain-containing protein n=1 Tax=Decorospora gaudefroyi TaxID=184978 RepID=A0A6A5KRY9_9PLEO|nr:hypothetical protein BDW02DRAFT_305957 [Decorospora gaudefroyi]
MRLASQSIWALVAASGYLGAVARAAGVLDIGLAFPRTNATYAPADDFPIVFAVQNSKLAEHLKPSIWYQVLDVTGDIETLIDSTHEFNWTSASEHDPYLLWSRVKVGGESKLRVLWQPRWTSCDQSHTEVGLARNRTENFLVDFEIRASGERADLVAATNNGNSENCPNAGVGIDVTDKTLEAATGSSAHETCAVLASSSPTPISNPCKVEIDKATVESMAAADLTEKCRGLNPPSECPKGGLANPTFAVAGLSTLAAVFGAALFLA